MTSRCVGADDSGGAGVEQAMMFHVKHSPTYTDEHAYLKSNAELLGVQLDDATAEALLRHVDLLLEANSKVNLTAIRERLPAIRLHVLDSVAVVPYVRESPAGLLADLGAGGGFPGIPIALLTGRQVTLVESVKKKATFLRDALECLGLAATNTVSPLRAEEEARRVPQHYSVVVARALSSLPSLVELASPLLQTGGLLIAMKGKLEDSEIKSGRLASRIVGMSEERIERYSLPDGEESRSIVLYRKTGPSSIKLPRNPGMAQRKPLA